MSNISKEILKNHISHKKFTRSTEVLTAMNGRFKDIIKAPSEAKIDPQLGYYKYDISEEQTPNSGNDYSKKTLKSEPGATWWIVKDELNCFIMIR